MGVRPSGEQFPIQHFEKVTDAVTVECPFCGDRDTVHKCELVGRMGVFYDKFMKQDVTTGRFRGTCVKCGNRLSLRVRTIQKDDGSGFANVWHHNLPRKEVKTNA